MAFFNVNPAAIGSTLATTAGAKIAQSVAQSLSPKLVQDVQRVLNIGNVVGNALGVSTGIAEIDGIFGLAGRRFEEPTAMLGGLSLKQAKAIYEQVKAARVARKNLFFLRLTDLNQPVGNYQPRGASGQGLGGLIASRIGPAVGSVAAGIAGAVGSIAGNAAGSAVGNFASQAVNGALGVGKSISGIAMNTFDLLAMDVSYGPSLVSDHVQVGSSFIDRPTGRNPTEMQITTMDDESGSIKRWFDGKLEQVAHTDGTFGLPSEYLVNIEVVHAIPSEQVDGYEMAYSKTLRLRPQSAQHDLSRREQAIAELSMTFVQFDGFMGIG
jgi:hypothetical protein